MIQMRKATLQVQTKLVRREQRRAAPTRGSLFFSTPQTPDSHTRDGYYGIMGSSAHHGLSMSVLNWQVRRYSVWLIVSISTAEMTRSERWMSDTTPSWT